MDENIQQLKKRLYVKISTTEDVTLLRHHLEKCKKTEVLQWIDENGYDILHHTIMAGNVEAEGMLFALGLFKPPHEPKKHSYIHVAANFGNRSVTAMLLQERPQDYTTTKTKFQWVKPPTEMPFVSKDGTSRVGPLDVAAECGYVGCVRTILDVSSVRSRLNIDPYNYLSAACASNSPSALRLLLKQDPNKDDIKTAVGAALKLANAECLDVLLRCNPNLTSLFSGMNLYHVLFSYSMSFKKEWYESLLTVTSVLLKHNQNPMSSVPFRTYPLYSLISHIPSSEFGKSSTFITACMVVLLNAHVDPNFDEVDFETKHESLNIQTAFGRSAFPSALHCLYGNVPNLLRHFDDDVTNIRRFVTKATETLLRHGADPDLPGPIEDSNQVGNALHAFMKVLVPLGLDERSMTTFRLLMQNGSNPNHDSEGTYPLNTFINEILVHSQAFGKISKYEEASTVEHVKEVVLTLLGNMTQVALIGSSRMEFEGKPTNDVQRKMFKLCRDEIVKYGSQLLSLKKMCRLKILEACRWRSTSVVELPLPLVMKKYINQC
ncbi:uncharacterized protein LOC128239275 [Mya arenaria]|uniref:uncharacterized protein LOC128239275 n=1 Tax=Mya arenaria TaxID=6604 RepID=UPI0022E2B555|nr:uncharacterized protein LOC128239275 [Mya arenaria]